MLSMKNYMEVIVMNTMDDILKDINMCRCDKCGGHSRQGP